MSGPPAHLPHWRPGTVAVLTTSGSEPHAIPVSTAVRAGDGRVLLALAQRRESLARLRGDPRVALTLMGEDDVAVTAHCRARVLREAMQVSDRVAAVELTVVDVQDHGQPTFAIDAGVRWHWNDPGAQRADEAIRDELRELAAAPA